MHSGCRTGLVVLSIAVMVGATSAQDTGPAPKPVTTTPPAPPPLPPAGAVAATVNGREIPELAVYRALLPVPEEHRGKARQEIISLLIENALIDQYLEQLHVEVNPDAVETRFKDLQSDANKKDPKGFENMLKAMYLTEADLKVQLANELRFDKFVEQQATEKSMRAMFDGNRAMFDGSMMRARHILSTPPEGNAQAAAQAREKLLAIKKEVEDHGAQAADKLGPGADNLAREKARIKALDEAFADFASKESACPSKKDGGNLPWFPRIGAGAMVEPFARAAFALKTYQMSDVVATQFGLHLILAVDQKPGKDVKFEDVRDFVKDVYADRLHEAIVARMRPAARIVINPPAAKQ
jgi:peptidyl-prolyl cis-trans isomerase C